MNEPYLHVTVAFLILVHVPVHVRCQPLQENYCSTAYLLFSTIRSLKCRYSKDNAGHNTWYMRTYMYGSLKDVTSHVMDHALWIDLQYGRIFKKSGLSMGTRVCKYTGMHDVTCGWTGYRHQRWDKSHFLRWPKLVHIAGCWANTMCTVQTAIHMHRMHA